MLSKGRDRKKRSLVKDSKDCFHISAFVVVVVARGMTAFLPCQ